MIWKKKHFKHKVVKRQRNLLTLNQIFCIKVLLTIDYIAVECLLSILPRERILIFEMLKLIIVDNICYRFLVPLVLLVNTKKIFPELWSRASVRRTKFYMTETRKIPRPPNSLAVMKSKIEFNRRTVIYVRSEM